MVNKLTKVVWILFILLLGIYNLCQANSANQAKKINSQGLELARESRVNEAIEKFNHSLGLNPEDGETYIHLANAYLQISNLI